MEGNNELSLIFKPAGRNGHAIVTAKTGGDVLAVEKVDLTKGDTRAKFVTKLCDGRPGIDPKAVEAELLKEAGAIATRESEKKPATPVANNEPAVDLLAKMPQAVRDEARAMLGDPKLFKRIVDDVAALGVAGERELTATTYIVGSSRLLEKPVSMIVQGPSSSGKSYIIEKTATLFPPESVLCATQMTPQALFHMPPGRLKHKFVVAGERSRVENDETAEATRALREMLSSGKLTKQMPVKGSNGIVTEEFEQEGPIAFVESTTLAKVFDEDANRCIMLTTDERVEQTQRIVSTLAQRYAGAPSEQSNDAIVQRHYAIQRILEGLPVVIPFAPRLGELFVSHRVETRRAFPQLLSVIQASALLHQFQRQRDNDGRVVASADDYQLAAYLLAKPFVRLLGGGLSDPAGRLLGRLETWASGTFTTSEAVAKERADASERSVRGWLNELRDAGAVELVEPGRGPKPTTWRLGELTANDMRAKGGPLPPIEKLFG